MTDLPPPAPSPGEPRPDVPAFPLVQIQIVGSTVTVDGVAIVHDNTRSLHHIAIQTAADRVARPLRRPVRAVASDDEGRASMLIHPDGSATDVILLDDALPVAPPTAAAAAAAAGTAGAAAGTAGAATTPIGPLPVEPLLDAPLDDYALSSGPPPAAIAPATRTPSHAAPPPPGSLSLSSKIVRSAALASALTAAVSMGVLLLGSRDDTAADRAEDSSGESSPATSTNSPTSPSPTSPSPTSPSPTSGASADSSTVAPELSVTALPGAKALRLTITTTSLPATAAVTVTSGGGKVIERSVELGEEPTDIEIARLPAGAASWNVEVAGAAPQSGRTTISFPSLAPTPSLTAVPVPTVPESVAPTPEPPVTTPVAPPSTPQSTPQPTAKPDGRSGLKPKSGFGKQKKG